MKILGLHFGHDATVSIIDDGEILVAMECERVNRIKHSMGLTINDILHCLSDVNLNIEDIDFCSITSTQLVEYVFRDKAQLDIKLGHTTEHNFPCSLVDKLEVTAKEFNETSAGWLDYVFTNLPNHPYHKFLPEGKDLLKNKENILGGFEKFVYTPLWDKVKTLNDISKTDYSFLINNNDVSYGFYFPATLFLNKKPIPSYIFSHHYAHAAYTFFESPHFESAIMTNDGAGAGGEGGYVLGMFAYGKGNRLFPITPNHMICGDIYDSSSWRIGLDAGKFMGLSSYGSPTFFSKDFVGNWFDIDKKFPVDWIKHCEDKAKKLKYDLRSFGKKKEILSPVNIDFASSTQKLIEESIIYASKSLKESLKKSDVDTKNLCLSGGVALNCPANTRLVNKKDYSNIFIPPSVGDTGLAIGSALALYYNVMGNKRNLKKDLSQLAFKGLNSSCTLSSIEKGILKFKNSLVIEKSEFIESLAANDLFRNKIIGWFDGRSELGPRALGHRSILANPIYSTNWAKVNKIKKRETWRPFAPIVLESEAKKYFSKTQYPSYFMLLNASVKTKKIPAVTHVDNSARYQSVNKNTGHVYNLLIEFKKLSGIPILLNTSFNGPGEPIVESINHAINFLLTSKLDSLYIPSANLKITRK